jgi:multidrug resistance efflux pump
MFKSAKRFVRFLLTSILVVAAVFAVIGLWEHYMVAPWTRDGQIRAQVADIAPQVAGQIVELHAEDNAFVHQGDLLYVIDKANYKVRVELAEADVASKQADLRVKEASNDRRQKLSTLSTSIEEKQQYEGQYTQAQSAYQSALANLEQAKLDLERTDVRSTVNGYVTNLLLRIGDYANTGVANISVIDSDSFWVTGYFEETKLGSFKIGDPAKIELMGFGETITGHVESITRGISTANATVSTQGLPSVEPVYTWVRLAQRIPVRVKIDQVPNGVTLAAGMTATVIVNPDNSKSGMALSDLGAKIASLMSRRP